MAGSESVRRAHLVLGRLGVEKGEEHVAIAVAPGVVCAEDVAQRGGRRVGLVEKGAGGCEEGVHGVH